MVDADGDTETQTLPPTETETEPVPLPDEAKPEGEAPMRYYLSGHGRVRNYYGAEVDAELDAEGRLIFHTEWF